MSVEISELDNFRVNGGEPPQCSLTLSFGEELSCTDDPTGKLIIVQVFEYPGGWHFRARPGDTSMVRMFESGMTFQLLFLAADVRWRCRGPSSRWKALAPSWTPSASCSLRWTRSHSTWWPCRRPSRRPEGRSPAGTSAKIAQMSLFLNWRGSFFIKFELCPTEWHDVALTLQTGMKHTGWNFTGAQGGQFNGEFDSMSRGQQKSTHPFNAIFMRSRELISKLLPPVAWPITCTTATIFSHTNTNKRCFVAFVRLGLTRPTLRI